LIFTSPFSSPCGGRSSHLTLLPVSMLSTISPSVQADQPTGSSALIPRSPQPPPTPSPPPSTASAPLPHRQLPAPSSALPAHAALRSARPWPHWPAPRAPAV